MIRANKLTQLEGVRNVGEFGENGEFGKNGEFGNKLTQLQGPRNCWRKR